MKPLLLTLSIFFLLIPRLYSQELIEQLEGQVLDKFEKNPISDRNIQITIIDYEKVKRTARYNPTTGTFDFNGKYEIGGKYRMSFNSYIYNEDEKYVTIPKDGFLLDKFYLEKKENFHLKIAVYDTKRNLLKGAEISLGDTTIKVKDGVSIIPLTTRQVDENKPIEFNISFPGYSTEEETITYAEANNRILEFFLDQVKQEKDASSTNNYLNETNPKKKLDNRKNDHSQIKITKNWKLHSVTGFAFGGVLTILGWRKGKNGNKIYNQYTSIIDNNAFVQNFPEYESRQEAFNRAKSLRKNSGYLLSTGGVFILSSSIYYIVNKKKTISKENIPNVTLSITGVKCSIKF